MLMTALLMATTGAVLDLPDLSKPRILLINGTNCPQGHYHAYVSWDIAKQLDNIKVDWSTQTDTAKHTSLAVGMLSETINDGYRIIRHCLGFLECSNPDCAQMVRAQSSDAWIARQAGTLCKCSQLTHPKKQFKLVHILCSNKATIIKYAGGVWYCNGEPHDHPQIPRTLHLSQDQGHRLQSLVTANPGAPPAALRAGKTVSDESSTDISNRLGNSKAAHYEIEKIRPSKPPSGDAFITQYIHS
ncbi:hypothetical protein AAF712_015281 [Marasmius tenuissimus]|uniref:Uncharacterized protein n=1 Tax=Marasmius tenuissimus TaxID=585030 RepID=A0ABR2ZA08_9AGAR